jgi:hypothetical protein
VEILILPKHNSESKEVDLYTLAGHVISELWTHLLKRSFSSCSEENCPRLATNSVEHGELLVCAAADTPGLCEVVCTCSVPAVLTLVLRGLVKMGVAAMGG